MNKLLLLASIVIFAECKRHSIEKQMTKLADLAGGIKWSSPSNFSNDEDYQKAVDIAQKKFNDVCNLPKSVTWGQIEKVGFQVVQGYMWWFEVELSDDIVHELSVYQNLEGTFKLTSCK